MESKKKRKSSPKVRIMNKKVKQKPAVLISSSLEYLKQERAIGDQKLQLFPNKPVYAEGFGPTPKLIKFLKEPVSPKTIGVFSLLNAVGLVLLLSALVFPTPQINQLVLIKTAQTVKVTSIVADGAPVKWSTLVKTSDIKLGKYLLSLPKKSKNIKITKVTSQQAKDILQQKPVEQVSLKQRIDIAQANQPKSFFARRSFGVGGFVASLLDGITKFFTADLGDAVSNVVDSVVPPTNPDVTLTPDAIIVDLSDTVATSADITAPNVDTSVIPETSGIQSDGTGTNTNLDSPVQGNDNNSAPTETPVTTENPPSSQNNEAPTAPATQTLDTTVLDTGLSAVQTLLLHANVGISPNDYAQQAVDDLQSVINSALVVENKLDVNQQEIDSANDVLKNAVEAFKISNQYIKVDYETPAPTITEQTTDTGKIVTVSSSNVEKVDCETRNPTKINAGLPAEVLTQAGASLMDAVKNFFKSISKFFSADLEQAVSDVIQPVVDQIVPPIDKSEMPTPADNSADNTATSDVVQSLTETPAPTDPVIQPDAPSAPEVAPLTLAETPLPVPEVAPADVAPVESPTDIQEGKYQDCLKLQTPLTDVLASTKIPEIYKVGEEDKIHIKWKNNGNQDVAFHAYDTNGNGKLDYVEWTVPHLSDQTFEIIFISKAFELDQDRNIVSDIYDLTKAQDNTWATVPSGHHVRATFQQILDNTKDNTIYAKATDPTQPVTIEVYPVYTDVNGNQNEGPLVTTFDNITDANTYKVLLTNLEAPTDVFDLKIIGGNIDIDYIVDPQNGGKIFTAIATGNYNVGTTWDQTSCASSCVAGTDYPGANDDVVISGAYTVTLTAVHSAYNLTISAGTLAQGANNFTLGNAFTISAGSITRTSGTFNSGVVTADGTTITFGKDGSTPATFSGAVSVTYPSIYLNGNVFNGTSEFTKTGAATDAPAGGNTFNSTTTITNSGSGTMYLAWNTSVGDTFNGNVTFTNSGAGGIEVGASSANTFAGNIIVNSTNGSGIAFGNYGGTLSLADTKTITVGGSDFSAGALNIKNFTQTGSTAQSLTLTGTAGLITGTGTTWNGNVTFVAPELYLNGSTFNGTANLTKNGAGNNAATGVNTFNSTTTITNSGAGTIFSAYHSGGDIYNGDVIFTNNGAGALYVLSGNYTSTFAGNVTGVQTSGSLLFDYYGVGGTMQFTKATGTQTLDSGGITIPKLTHTGAGTLQLTGNNLTVNNTLTNSAGTLDLNGKNLTTTGSTFTNSATIKLTGDETITNVNPTLSAGAVVEYTATSGSRNIQNWTYTNSGLKFSGSGGTFVVNASKTVSGFVLGAGAIGQITSGQTLTVNGDFTSSANIGSHATLSAVTPSAVAYMPVSGTATVNYVDGTDIDSTGGTLIDNSTGGTNLRTVNWYVPNTTPNVPTLVSPANASYTNDNTPTLSANYSDPDTGDTGTTNYRIDSLSAADCIAGSPTNVVASGASSASASNNENTTWTPGSSIGSGAVYYWCAQNNDGVATSAWTSMGIFTLDVTNPTATITSPTASYYNNASVIFGASGSDTNLGSLVSNLDSSLVSWWRGENNATDYMGNNNGTEQGGVTYTNGKLGKAFTFDGSTGRIDASSVNFGTNGAFNFTISAWINIKVRNTNGDAIFADAAGSGKFGFWVRNGSGTQPLQFQNYYTSGTGISGNTPVSVGAWHHAVYTFDGTNGRIYLDGSIDGTGSQVGTYGTGSWKIGDDNQFYKQFNGQIDDVQVYNRALAPDEITALYNGTAISHSSTLSQASHIYKVYAQDLAGNVGVSSTNTFTVDTVPPATPSATPAGGTYDAPQSVSLSSTGSSAIYYTINGSTPTAGSIRYTVPIIISTATTLKATAFDLATNQSGFMSESYVFDVAAPTTSSTAMSNGSGYSFGNWTGHSVSVILSCADNDGGTGCATNYPKYCVDTSDTCTPTTTYSTAVPISTEGISYIRYFSQDTVPNIETVKSATIQIDTTKPITVADAGSYVFDNWTNQNVTVDLSCGDAGGSGCLATLYCLDTADNCTPNISYSSNPPFAISTQGVSYIRYLSTDAVSNTEGVKSQTIKIDAIGPVVNAGTDKTSGTEFSQIATASDVDSGIVSYLWEKVSGPGTVIFSSADSLETIISVSAAGSYVIKFTAVDNKGNSGSDTFNLDWTRNMGPVVPPTPPVTPTQPTATATTTTTTTTITTTTTTNIINQIGQQLNNIAQEVQNITNVFNPNAGQPQINYPPIAESVPEKSPLPLQGWNVMEVKPISQLALTPVNSGISFFANRIPQFKDVLTAFGIDVNNLSSVQKVVGTELYLPGLTQVVLTPAEILAINKYETQSVIPEKSGIHGGTNLDSRLRENDTGGKGLQNPGNLAINKFASVQGVPLADLSFSAKQKIPTNIVFVKTGGELIDYKVAISVDRAGQVAQKINTIVDKPIELVIKPDQPAQSVTGFISLNKLAVGKEPTNILADIGGLLTASLIPPVQPTVGISSSGSALLLDKFAYVETTPGIYTASILAPGTEGEYNMSTIIQYKDINIAPKETKMTVIVNPEGYVYSQQSDGRLRIEGASVSLYWLNPNTNKYELWPADKFLQKNPILTNNTGKYSFLVPEGTYKISVKDSSYSSFESDPFVMKEDLAVSKDVELFKKLGWFDWLNWQMAVVILLIILILSNFWRDEKIRNFILKILKRSPP